MDKLSWSKRKWWVSEDSCLCSCVWMCQTGSCGWTAGLLETVNYTHLCDLEQQRSLSPPWLSGWSMGFSPACNKDVAQDWRAALWGVGWSRRPRLFSTIQIRRRLWTADDRNRWLFFNCRAMNRPVNNSSRNLALTNIYFLRPWIYLAPEDSWKHYTEGNWRDRFVSLR